MPEAVVQQVDALATAPPGETAAARADRLERLRTLRAIAVQTAQLDALGQVGRPSARHLQRRRCLAYTAVHAMHAYCKQTLCHVIKRITR